MARRRKGFLEALRALFPDPLRQLVRLASQFIRAETTSQAGKFNGLALLTGFALVAGAGFLSLLDFVGRLVRPGLEWGVPIEQMLYALLAAGLVCTGLLVFEDRDR